MLVTQQRVLRRFWHAVIPMSHLKDGPKPFTLLGERIVLWKDADGAPAAVRDRCCHRTARLSKGWVTHGEIVCGYHGWTYDRSGRCTRVPQAADQSSPTGICVTGYHCEERYGYAWVCLDQPLTSIPDFPESRDPGFRQIDEFYELWQCGALRLMENSFDNAHFSFVHQNSFGKANHPKPSSAEIVPFEDGFHFHTVVPVKNPEGLRKALGTDEAETVRTMSNTWWIPFIRKLRIAYPHGLVHTIVTCATPIDDHSIQVVQFVFRNDTEEQVKAEDVIAFDRVVTAEDRGILEATDADTPIDLSRRAEMHMASDRPGLIMRQRLMELFEKHGETEVCHPAPVAG